MSDGGTLSDLGALLIKDVLPIGMAVVFGLALAVVASWRGQKSKPKSGTKT